MGFVLEDWSVKSLVKTKQAKSRMDASLGEFLRQVEYQALWNGKHSVQVGKFFPSHETLLRMSNQNDKSSLSAREWTCPDCGT